MDNPLQKLLNILFPPRPAELILQRVNNLPTRIDSDIFMGSKVVYLSTFSNPQIHAAIVENKYYGNKKSHQLLGVMLGSFLAESGEAFDVAVPIPLSANRHKERGYNQVSVILNHCQIKQVEALSRTNAESQTKLNRAQRMANVRAAFSLDKEKAARLQGQHILLVDDVVTTGATLTAAAKVLAAAEPASITLLALAH